MSMSVTDRSGSCGMEYFHRNAGVQRKFGGIAEEAFMELRSPGERTKRSKTDEISRIELYERMRQRNESDGAERTDADSASENPNQAEKSLREEEDTRTDTEVVVKPDGSRVLMVTMRVGGMETSMSIELSEPTDMPNEGRGSVLSQYLKNPDVHKTGVDSGMDMESETYGNP